ncbi:hypothetical protein EXIGLDRAFT_735208 [Exidia glandulosa HHB12029]|uniref:PEBP-like protein n=1 Tax=Exidia glandulosa HHB12029 TaxID=1314781 RepID=A0A165JXM7_EXIGL|nr:hypothetical protein EXIGLDRAFT_735208 [Exidia glandulosa HHB12029]
MRRAALLPIIISLVASTSAFPTSLHELASSLRRRASDARLKTDKGYVSPVDKGGKMLTSVPGTFPEGLGEPLNVVISGNSDAAVLVDSPQNGGLRNYWLSLRFAGECLGQHLGSDQAANLGDGNGALNETAVMRFDYDDPYLGTCQETVKGGNHFRYWVQNGKDANTGAVFMAASAEKPAAEGHDILPNGYNLARDWLVGNATGGHDPIPTYNLTAGATFTGSTVFAGYTYRTTATYVDGLLKNSSDGVNHFQSVPVKGLPAIDGLVAVLEVHITNTPAGAPAPSGGAQGGAESVSARWTWAVALVVGAIAAWTVC